MKSLNPETIRALTPMFLAAIGGAIGIVVLVNPGLRDAQWTAGLGLAGTAIAGASGLAQSTRSDSNIVQKDVQNIQIERNLKNEVSEAK
ncbi:hypothetical protein [Aerosakkonema funiforme]|uniref:hypothetical protein n=1 Tax=Aerosakkonema funiforme TaxID=1246630 RepID=UPI0035B6BF57